MFDRKHRPSESRTNHLIVGATGKRKPTKRDKAISEMRIKHGINRQYKDVDNWLNNLS